MPRHGEKNNGLVSIQLLNPKSYYPGDIVLGTVTIRQNQAHPQSPRLKLCGRAKTKIIKKNTNSTSIYRGRAFFFDLSQILSAGDADRTQTDDGIMVWNFQIQIPAAPSKSAESDSYSKSGAFISNKVDVDISQHDLPSIFYYKQTGYWSGTTQEAYVEYWLEASSNAGTATYPLFLRAKSTEIPIQESETDMRLLSFAFARKSQRLLPEHADKELTFGQRNTRFWTPSRVPKYAFKVKLNVPRTWQIDHPDPLPIQIWLSSVLNKKVTTISCDDMAALPPVKILSLKAKLKSECSTRAPGIFIDNETSQTSKHPIGVAYFKKNIIIPAVQGISDSLKYGSSFLETTSTAPEPLALGQILGIHISHKSNVMLGQRVVSPENNIYPSFATYNITLSYLLRLELCIECAGEVDKFDLEIPMKLLPAAQVQIRDREEKLGSEGMKKNYDDLKQAWGNAQQLLNTVSNILGAFAPITS